MRIPVIERWLDEGWSPWRIAVGAGSLVALGVTVVGYVAHPRHPGAVWWLLAAVAVVAVWALLEMVRWRVRYKRLQQRPAGPEPLQPRYDQSPTYRHPVDSQSWITEHRVGVFNPPDQEARRVRMYLVRMEPQPRNVLESRYEAVIPYTVPLQRGGDPSAGETPAQGSRNSGSSATQERAATGT